MKGNELMRAREIAQKKTEITIYTKDKTKAAKAGEAKSPAKRITRLYPLNWIPRDPFMELVEREVGKEEELPFIELEGILEFKGEKVAIINNTYIKEGEEILKQRVVKIGKDFVILSSGPKQYTIDLKVPLEGISRTLIPKESESVKDDDEIVFNIKRIKPQSLFKDRVEHNKKNDKQNLTNNRKIINSNYYAVQVASFSSREAAIDFKNKLLDIGYDTYIVPTDPDNNMFRVRVGKYNDLNTAKKIAYKLENKEKLKTWITEY